jgi:protein SCO1
MKVFKILLVTIVAINLCSCKSEPQKGLPYLGTLPKFSLFDQNGKKFTQDDLTDKTTLLHLFFTSCPSFCPTIISDVKFIVSTTNKNDTPLKVVSVTVMPEKDTPRVLNAYAKKLKLNFSQEDRSWSLLTGEFKDLSNLTKELKLGELEIPDAHSARILLIDARLNIRGYYLGNNEEDLKRLGEALTWLSSY